MMVSGGCAVAVGFLFGGDPALLVALCVVWGATVIADSVQFSASVAELSEPGRIGTMLTTQTCGGFLLTLVTIHLLPPLVEALGWRYAFAALAIGPAIGVAAMLRLRSLPQATRLAGGRRYRWPHRRFTGYRIMEPSRHASRRRFAAPQHEAVV